MPKVSLPALPVSALFGVVKPSGPTSMSVVDTIKQLVTRSRLFLSPDDIAAASKNQGKRQRGKRQAVKMGQGGTLDPLADGVLVIGIGGATKHLDQFLGCTKVSLLAFAFAFLLCCCQFHLSYRSIAPPHCLAAKQTLMTARASVSG